MRENHSGVFVFLADLSSCSPAPASSIQTLSDNVRQRPRCLCGSSGYPRGRCRPTALLFYFRFARAISEVAHPQQTKKKEAEQPAKKKEKRMECSKFRQAVPMPSGNRGKRDRQRHLSAVWVVPARQRTTRPACVRARVRDIPVQPPPLCDADVTVVYSRTRS